MAISSLSMSKGSRRRTTTGQSRKMIEVICCSYRVVNIWESATRSQSFVTIITQHHQLCQSRQLLNHIMVINNTRNVKTLWSDDPRIICASYVIPLHWVPDQQDYACLSACTIDGVHIMDNQLLLVSFFVVVEDSTRCCSAWNLW
jgi:hypothetical protein